MGKSMQSKVLSDGRSRRPIGEHMTNELLSKASNFSPVLGKTDDFRDAGSCGRSRYRQNMAPKMR
jgi:hypothetical protein